MVLGMGGFDGKTLIILGLERENIDRLLKGEPIRVTRDSHGGTFPDDLAIQVVFGETKRDIMKQLNKANGAPVQRIDPWTGERIVQQ